MSRVDERDEVVSRRRLILANVLVLVLVVFRQAFRFHARPSPGQDRPSRESHVHTSVYGPHAHARVDSSNFDRQIWISGKLTEV